MKSKLAALFSVGWISALALASPSVSGAASYPETAFRFVDDGGEHPPSSCESTALPRGLVARDRFQGFAYYYGSVQIEFADRNAAGVDAWENYFGSEADCEKARSIAIEYP